MCDGKSDWNNHFVRDGSASLAYCQHPIEVAYPSVKTLQLADQMELVDWIGIVSTSPGPFMTAA